MSNLQEKRIVLYQKLEKLQAELANVIKNPSDPNARPTVDRIKKEITACKIEFETL